MEILPGISNVNRRAYMRTSHVPLNRHQQNQELLKAQRKTHNLIKQKNYLTADRLLSEDTFLSDLLKSDTGNKKRSNAHSAPPYTIQDLSKYHTVIEDSTTNLRPSTEKHRTGSHFKSPSLYKLSRGKDGDIDITPHVTLAHLCDSLKEKGLGDPRDQLKPHPSNPLPLLRRRKRQERKYPFYNEKLRGRALQDMEQTNSKAIAFIEQQKEAHIRTASANWRDRYNRLQEFDKVSHDSEISIAASVHFAVWDEDSKPNGLDENSYHRIQDWLTDVQNALCPSHSKD